MGQESQSSFLKDGSTKALVTLYPLAFWVLVLKIQEQGSVIHSAIVTNPVLRDAWTAYFYVGAAHLGIIVLLSVWGTLAFLKPVKALQREIPKVVRNLSYRSCKDANAALRNQVKEVLVSTLTRGQLGFFALYSRSKQNILKLVLVATIPGRIIVTIEAARFLAPFALSWIPLGPYDFSSLSVLVIPLVTFSAINLNYLLAEEKSSHYRRFRPRYYIPRRILAEFTIVSRVPTLCKAIAKYRFGAIEVESPHEDKLANIIKDVLSALIGAPFILLYNFEELYPPSELERLDRLAPDVRDFVKEARPAAIVAIYNNECVLFAEVDMLDVRRMDVWTRSPALTQKIVTKSEKLLVESGIRQALP